MSGCGGKETSPPPAAPAPAAPAAAPAPAAPPQAPSAPAEDSVSEILAKGKKIDGLYYEFVMTVGSVKAEGKTWIEGKMLRNDILADGQAISNIIDMEQGVAYTYMPSQKMAMKIDIGKVDTDVFQIPTAYTDDIDTNVLNIVETTTYEGLKCKVMVLAQGQEELKMWISEEYGIPVRVEMMQGGQKTVLEYKNLKVGPIPADVFMIPQGVQIIEMNR
jgi:outer membrane lipoprotein-sorting protein